MHILILKGEGKEWGPIYREYLEIFTHGCARFSEVDTEDVKAVNDMMAACHYDCYVITGSTCDAHDSAEYVLNLIEHIKELFSRQAKIIGICFGHQIVARALGGETGPCDKGWGSGPRSISLAAEADEFLMSCVEAYETWQEAVAKESSNPSALALLPLEDIKKKCSLNIFYSHQDQVSRQPCVGNLRCLGGNEHCPFAGFYSPDRTVLTFQGHPEFDTALMLDIIDMLDGQGAFKKMGYAENLDEVVSMIKAKYIPVDGEKFSPLLDNLFLGKCIASVMLPN